MKLGSGHSTVRRMRRKRTTWFVASGILTFVFLLFVGGTTWSLVTSDYPWEPWEPWELAADLVTLPVSALLALFTGLLGQRCGDQAADLDERLARAQAEPPRLAPANDPVQAEVEAMTPRLRLYGDRAALLGVAWVIVLALGVTGSVLISMTAQRLLDEGERAAGTVVAVYEHKGGTTITVEYSRGSVFRTVQLDSGHDSSYSVGQRTTVFYDPADPEHVRTLEEADDDPYLTGFSVVTTIVALVMIPFSAVAARRWHRRYRLVRASGWHPARADVHVVQGSATISVRYRDGRRLELRGLPSLHTPVYREFFDVPVWIGGEGRDVVVLVPRGPIRKSLHAVPAKVLIPQP